MSTTPDTEHRSYGCSMGCGNPYDFVVVVVADPEATMMLCAPCFVRNAHDMVQGFIAANSEIMDRVEEMGMPEQVPMNGPGVKRRGRNAPSDIEDPDALEEFEALEDDDESFGTANE